MRLPTCSLVVTSLSFDIAGLELYLPLTTGAKVVLAERVLAQPDGQALLRLGGCSCRDLHPGNAVDLRRLLLRCRIFTKDDCPRAVRRRGRPPAACAGAGGSDAPGVERLRADGNDHLVDVVAPLGGRGAGPDRPPAREHGAVHPGRGDAARASGHGGRAVDRWARSGSRISRAPRPDGRALRRQPVRSGPALPDG